MESIELLIDLWDSRRWRWWTLVAGVLLVIVTAIVATIVATVIGQDVAGLVLLGLLAEIVVVSVIGSGVFDGISRRMSRGGLARETADLDELQELKTGRRKLSEAELQRRDRRAVRAGILVLPVFLTFIVLLFAR